MQIFPEHSVEATHSLENLAMVPFLLGFHQIKVKHTHPSLT